MEKSFRSCVCHVLLQSNELYSGYIDGVMKTYFMDGCFDGFHYGHVNALFQAKQKCDYLKVGTHTDIEMETFKKAPMVPYHERVRMLEHCGRSTLCGM